MSPNISTAADKPKVIPLLLEKKPRSPQYKATEKGLVRFVKAQDDDGYDEILLTNFVARIVAEVIEDDGVERKREFELEVTLLGKSVRCTVSAGEFAGMSWVPSRLGAKAIVFVNNRANDHVRTAIQALSNDVEERTVYAHMGWRKVGADWIYLHSGGAIGASGAIAGLQVHLPDLPLYELPDPSEDKELHEAIRSSLALLDAAPDRVTVPSYCAIWRAPLGECDLSVHIHGKTGQGKSELAAQCQRHYGAAMNRVKLPANWSSTGNALEMVAFRAKDALLIIDEYVPTTNLRQSQMLNRDADRVFRAAGNSSGRQRLRPDGTPVPVKPPRALILSTGEDLPRGQSLTARIVFVELREGDLDWHKVTNCQKDASDGLYAKAMAGYVKWLAPQYDDTKAELRRDIDELRNQVSGLTHKRTAANIANLAVGMKSFLRYAVAVGAITQQESERLWDRTWAALTEVAALQQESQEHNEPTGQFIKLVASAITSGDAYIADEDGDEPKEASAWGWNKRDPLSPDSPRGKLIGWIKEDGLYLDAQASFTVVQRLLQQSGETFPLTLQTLKKRLQEKGLIQGEQEGDRSRLEVRRTLSGRRRRVLWFKPDALDED